jgi:predicted  nucleic acid-binding Zn-ribbon protein
VDTVRFNAPNAPAPRAEELNHPTASPFQKNQISFHIGSAYLRDFTPSGIERFVKANQPGGKPLDVAEVKAFIERVAQNPEAVKNNTFDLSDPDLGLRKDDGVTAAHIRGAFSLDMHRRALPEGQSHTEVRFVDVTKVTFDLKDKEERIAGVQKDIQALRPKLTEAKEALDEVKSERSKAEEKIGSNAQNRLTELRAKIEDNRTMRTENQTRLEGYRSELAHLKAGVGSAEGAEKTRMQTEIQRLERSIRGAEGQIKSLDEEHTKLQEQYKEKHGSFLGSKYSFEDLHRLNGQVTAAETKHQGLHDQVEEKVHLIKMIQDGTAPTEKPAAAPTVDKPATPTPAKPAEAPPAEQTALAPPADADAFKALAPKDQAIRLSTMEATEQRQYLATLDTSAKTQVQAQVTTFIENLRTTQVKTSETQQQLQAYERLNEQLSGAPATAPAPEGVTPTPGNPTAPATEEAVTPTPAQPAPAATGTTTTTTTTTKTDKYTAHGITLGRGMEAPADAITIEGAPFVLEGQVITRSMFASLSSERQFHLLMRCESKDLKPLLTSITKEQRSAIRAMAAGVVQGFSAQVRAEYASGSVSTQTHGAVSAVNVTRAQMSMYASSEDIARAREIIRIIDELDGAPSGQSASVTQTQQTTTTTTTLGADQYMYRVKPGDTARSVARTELKDEFRAQEIFRLNPQLEGQFRQQGVTNLHDKEFNSIQGLTEIILSRKPLDNDPVRTAPRQAPPKEEPTNATLREEKPTAVTPPPAAPVVATPAAPPKPETAPLRDADKPAEQPAAKAPEAPAKPETAPVREQPAATAPQPAPEVPKPEPEPKPVVPPAPTPRRKTE